MGADQKEIYYLVGKDRTTIESGPYLEGFKARNLEVLFCYEAVDEYVMNNVREFDGKKIISADHIDVKLSEIPTIDMITIGSSAWRILNRYVFSVGRRNFIESLLTSSEDG